MGSPPAQLPARALIADTPFVAQERYYCGPASLAMVMDFYGREVSQDTLAEAVYVPELEGALQAEMLGATRRYGFLPYVLTPRLGALLAEVAAGHPVIVLQNLALSWYPVWHYAVAIGYDLGQREIVLHSGTTANYRVALDTFERTWARSQYWALVALPAGKLPRDDAPLRALQAAATLEETGRLGVAREAYTAAVRRWPKNAAARLALGNAAYAQDDTQTAIDAFSKATHIAPRLAAAHNNLAVSLADIGCRANAVRAASCAVALDGQSAAYRDTLRQARAARERGPRAGACIEVECPLPSVEDAASSIKTPPRSPPARSGRARKGCACRSGP